MYPHQQTTFFSDVFRSTFLFKSKNSVKKVCTQCHLGAERRIQVNMKDIGFKYVGGSKKIKNDCEHLLSGNKHFGEDGLKTMFDWILSDQ